MPLVRADNRALTQQQFNCKACGHIVLISQPYVECDSCELKFHLKCKNIYGVNISRVEQEVHWFCDKNCQNKKKKPQSPVPSADVNNRNEKNSEGSVIDAIQQRFDTLENQYSEIISSQDDLSKKFDNFYEQFNQMLQENVNLKQKLNSVLDSQINHLKRIKDLEFKVDQYEQAKLDTNLLIFGLPETEDDPIKAFTAISTEIQSTATTADIQNIHFFKKKYSASQNSSQNSTKSSPNNPPLFIQFNTNRNELLDKKKTHKQLFLKQIGLTVARDSQIFIREQLTLYKRNLYKLAQNLRTSHDFQFIWIDRSRILAKKQNLSRVHEIRTETDIRNIGRLYENNQKNNQQHSNSSILTG